MKSKDMWKVFACAWIGTSLAVITGIYITGSAWCLWALIFPACMGTKSSSDDNDSDDESGSITEED